MTISTAETTLDIPTETDRARAHYLRALMYADHAFLLDTRRGWEEEQRQEGMSSAEYRLHRGL